MPDDVGALARMEAQEITDVRIHDAKLYPFREISAFEDMHHRDVVEGVPGIDRDVVAKRAVDGGFSTPELAAILEIIHDECPVMDEFEDHRDVAEPARILPKEVENQQEENRPPPFAAAIEEIPHGCGQGPLERFQVIRVAWLSEHASKIPPGEFPGEMPRHRLIEETLVLSEDCWNIRFRATHGSRIIVSCSDEPETEPSARGRLSWYRRSCSTVNSR